MSPQELFLFAPKAIYFFLLSLLNIPSLGNGMDTIFILLLAFFFWGQVYRATIAMLKKMFGINSPNRP